MEDLICHAVGYISKLSFLGAVFWSIASAVGNIFGGYYHPIVVRRFGILVLLGSV